VPGIVSGDPRRDSEWRGEPLQRRRRHAGTSNRTPRRAADRIWDRGWCRRWLRHPPSRRRESPRPEGCPPVVGTGRRSTRRRSARVRRASSASCRGCRRSCRGSGRW
jgi:hypothetical protein